jgi:hypothetical protein
MVQNARKLTGYTINATDGAFGKVDDFYFNERFWLIRYLVAGTEGWLPNRLVLISPFVITKVDLENQSLAVNLNREQVINSPPISYDMPVSRAKEIELLQYYGWPDFWQPLEVNLAKSAVLLTKWTDKESTYKKNPNERVYNPYLRSTHEIFGYKIRAKRGYAGHIDDYLIDIRDWSIQYFIVKTNLWGRKVLLAPNWIDKVDWAHRRIRVQLARKLIKNAEVFHY